MAKFTLDDKLLAVLNVLDGKRSLRLEAKIIGHHTVSGP